MGDRIGVQLLLRKIYLSLTNHPGQLSLAIPPWVGAMSTGQRAVMLCDWGVKADMVLFAGNTVWSISERVRGVCIDALYKSTFTTYLLTTLSTPENKTRLRRWPYQPTWNQDDVGTSETTPRWDIVTFWDVTKKLKYTHCNDSSSAIVFHVHNLLTC